MELKEAQPNELVDTIRQMDQIQRALLTKSRSELEDQVRTLADAVKLLALDRFAQQVSSQSKPHPDTP